MGLLFPVIQVALHKFIEGFNRYMRFRVNDDILRSVNAENFGRTSLANKKLLFVRASNRKDE